MSWKNLPSWLRGGIIAIPISFVLIPLCFIIGRILGAGEDFVWFIIPEFFLAGMSLAMRGTPATLTETILTIVIALAIFLFRIFVIGALLGLIYGKFANKNKRKLFLMGIAIILIILLLVISYRTKDSWSVYNSINSPKECTSIFNKFIGNFDINRCYQQLAIKNNDVAICDNIKTPSSMAETPDDFKWFCYEEVAHAKNDFSVCELIPGKTYNKYNVETKRRDGCFNWFKACDKIEDLSLKEDCLKSNT